MRGTMGRKVELVVTQARTSRGDGYEALVPYSCRDSDLSGMLGGRKKNGLGGNERV